MGAAPSAGAVGVGTVDPMPSAPAALSKSEWKALMARCRAAVGVELFRPIFPWAEEASGWVSLRSTRKTATVTASWGGVPTEEAVRAALGPICEPAGVSVRCQRTLVWSCGQLHASAHDAWVAHHGGAHETLEGACACCGAGGEYVFTEAALQRLGEEGEDFAPPCRPGEYVGCPACAGRGWSIDRIGTAAVPCGGCGGTATFDLDTAQGRAGLEATVAIVQASLASRPTTGGRRLP